MDISIDKKELVKALTAVCRTAAKKTRRNLDGECAVEIDARIHGGASFRVVTFDARVDYPIHCATHVYGAAAVEAHTLLEAVRAQPDGDVRLVATRAHLHVNERAMILSRILEMEPNPAPSRTFRIPAPLLTSALGDVAYAISSEETRYYLNGVCLHATPSSLDAVATDGRQLAAVALPLPRGAEGTSMIIPAQAVREIIKLWSKSTDMLTIGVSMSHMRIEGSGGICYETRLINGTYPNYERVIPIPGHIPPLDGIEANPVLMTINRQAMLDAVKDMLAAGDQKAVISTKCLITDAGRVSMVLVGERGVELCASVTLDCDAKMRHPAVELGINPHYLIGTLSHIKGNSVKVWFADPGSPMLFAGDPGARHVVMPMRVPAPTRAKK